MEKKEDECGRAKYLMNHQVMTGHSSQECVGEQNKMRTRKSEMREGLQPDMCVRDVVNGMVWYLLLLLLLRVSSAGFVSKVLSGVIVMVLL